MAVQEYGISNPRFLAQLKQRGAKVMQVPVYRWALPHDLGPLRNAVTAIASGNIHATLFTSAIQARHMLEIAGQMGMHDGLL